LLYGSEILSDEGNVEKFSVVHKFMYKCINKIDLNNIMYTFIFFEHINSFVPGWIRDGLSNETSDKWT